MVVKGATPPCLLWAWTLMESNGIGNDLLTGLDPANLHVHIQYLCIAVPHQDTEQQNNDS